MTSTSTHQYACTKCFNWFQFEQLTKDSQLCQECSKCKTEDDQVINGNKDQKKTSAAKRTMRCKFCRTELQGSDQLRTHHCERCAKNKADYGEPRNCSLCNLSAAFIGSKCRRCAASVKKYGPPTQCQQCKLKAAFKHPKAQLGGRRLCWLCASTAQKAIKRVKRKASEEKAHRAKMSKTILSYTGSGGSPTELVIEEEVIQEKDSDWDDFHDMDYRLPPSTALIESLSESVAVKTEKTKSLSPVSPEEETKQKHTPSPDAIAKSEKRHSCKRSSDNARDARAAKPESRAGRKSEMQKLNPKLSRRSAPPLLNSKNHKHATQPASNNHKADLTVSTSKLLDAKILRLQKKLSHKKGIDNFSSSQKKSNNSPEKKTGKTKDPSAPTKVTDGGPTSMSAFKMADSGPSSLSAFKVTESGPGSSLPFDRFKTSDSASSSPLPVVNDGNIVLVTQLRAEISGLKKQLGKKDQEMIEKDKQISCIKVEHLREQRELRAKMKELIAKHAETLEQLQKKNQDLLKKISQLSKGRA